MYNKHNVYIMYSTFFYNTNQPSITRRKLFEIPKRQRIGTYNIYVYIIVLYIDAVRL